MTPILYSFLGLLGGAFLVGIIVAVIFFFRYLQGIKTSLDELRSVLKTLSKDNTLSESLSSFRDLVETGKVMIQKIGVLNTTVDLFYKVAVQSDQMIRRGEIPAPASGDSEIYAYDEGRAAEREAQRKLRQSGVEIPPDKEIPSDKAVGAQA